MQSECMLRIINTFRRMSKSREELLKEQKELEQELKKAKKEAWEAQLSALAYRKLVEHMEKKYHIRLDE